MKKTLLTLTLAFLLAFSGCASGGDEKSTAETEPVLSTEAIEPENSIETPSEETEAPPEEISTEEVVSTEENTEEIESETPAAPTEPIRGIYVSAWVAGTKSRMDEMIAGIDATELNAIVIDVKDDEGRIVWEVDSPLINETGAVRVLVNDMPALVQTLHDHGIYVIGRLVCFRDAYIYQTKPEWVVHNEDGSIYRDEKDFAWIDPSCTEAWDYLLEVADQCQAVGFDEIQFDYVRYPTKATEAMVGVDGTGRKQKITEFASFAKQHFTERNMPFSMDVFGIVIHAEYDRNIVGQDYAALSYETDCLSPMVYPSHYADGTYDVEYPDLYPYEIIYASMTESKELLAAAAPPEEGDIQASVRPWLQGFTANYLKHYQAYGAAEIRTQIQAVYDAGYTEWLIWDPSESYPWDAFLPAEDATEDGL